MIELIGPDHPIDEKIKCARTIHRVHGPRLLEAQGFRLLLNRYEEAIDHTWSTMDETGIVKVCTMCATKDGGSCCGSGIERRFDVTLLLINLLMGVDLPESPYDISGCWFLGPNGCTIRARHTICVNYLCRRLREQISPALIHKVQEAVVLETDLAFLVEEKIKGLLRNGAHQ